MGRRAVRDYAATMRAASRRQHSVVALTAASAVVVAGLGTLPEQSAALQPGPLATKNVVAPIPVLDWQPCLGGSLECTRATVPLDYDDPNGATTSLFLSRRPADRPANRIGTLFINPGGPGGPSSRFVRYFADRLGNKVLRRFDIVGIDPRGIGRSTRMHCHPAGTIPPDPREFIPLTAAKARPVIRYYTFLAEGCAATASEITDHMTTADTARDMDLIRQALGDAQLTYYGISYGSVLGATYAAMFPDSIRAMVLDGVVNPGAWYRGAARGQGPCDDADQERGRRLGVARERLRGVRPRRSGSVPSGRAHLRRLARHHAPATNRSGRGDRRQDLLLRGGRRHARRPLRTRGVQVPLPSHRTPARRTVRHGRLGANEASWPAFGGWPTPADGRTDCAARTGPRSPIGPALRGRRLSTPCPSRGSPALTA